MLPCRHRRPPGYPETKIGVSGYQPTYPVVAGSCVKTFYQTVSVSDLGDQGLCLGYVHQLSPELTPMLKLFETSSEVDSLVMSTIDCQLGIINHAIQLECILRQSRGSFILACRKCAFCRETSDGGFPFTGCHGLKPTGKADCSSASGPTLPKAIK